MGLEQGTRFGEQLIEAVDSNGNGVAEIFVAAPSDDTIDLGAGAVYLLDVDSTDNSSPVAAFFGAGLSDHFGHDFQIADINMDGFDDLVAGAYGVDDSATGAGAVYLFMAIFQNGIWFRLQMPHYWALVRAMRQGGLWPLETTAQVTAVSIFWWEHPFQVWPSPKWFRFVVRHPNGHPKPQCGRCSINRRDKW